MASCLTSGNTIKLLKCFCSWGKKIFEKTQNAGNVIDERFRNDYVQFGVKE